MLTASILNSSLVIYTPTSINGVSTNLLFVFEDNKFKTISTYSASGNNLNLSLSNQVQPNSNVKINLYTGGISSSSASYTTSVIIADNLTTFEDVNVPSLTDMMLNNNYNFTSMVFSNVITGITTQDNFPTANIIVKRTPPVGKITINEGYLGPMKVHRFAALSSSFVSLPEDGSVEISKYFAISYISYANQTITGIGITFLGDFGEKSIGRLELRYDYFGTVSQSVAASSTLVDFSNQTDPYLVFEFNNVEIPEGDYWLVYQPYASSNPVLNFSIPTNSLYSFYSNQIQASSDGIIFSPVSSIGASINIYTQRGFALSSIDAVYNQLDQPQSNVVQYGDSSNMGLYTTIAQPTSQHYIQKNLLDTNTPVYALEVLADSDGQNQYELIGLTTSQSDSLFSMIANPLTEEIVRYTFYNPTLQYYGFQVMSLGDYYCKGDQGTVLVSAEDFVGLSRIEISNTSSFPVNSTTVIDISDSAQEYLSNLDYTFGGLGSKFTTVLQDLNYSITNVYATVVDLTLKYILVSNSNVFLYDGTTTENILSLSNTIVSSSTTGLNGVIICTTSGDVYSITGGIATKIAALDQVITSSSVLHNDVYLGVSTTYDSSSVQSRKRIYRINSQQNVIKETWANQIPEPSITFIYGFESSLLIGSYDQNTSTSSVYQYYNNSLIKLYSGVLRPDAAYYSSGKIYVALGGSSLMYSIVVGSSLSSFIDSGAGIYGSVVKQISKRDASIIVVTDLNTFIIDDTNYVTTPLSDPAYSTEDQRGLLVEVQNNNLGISNFPSSTKTQNFSNVNFDPSLNGFTSSYLYQANGYVVFSGISTFGISTSFYLQYPTNSTIQYLRVDGQNVNIVENVFTQNFYPLIPKRFELSILGFSTTGIGTIALYNGISTFEPIVGISSFVPPKIINSYYKTGGESDLFGFADGSLRSADVNELSSNQYFVYARFTDINGIVNGDTELASDYIYNQIKQQANNQALPSGRIIQVDPSSTNTIQYVPPFGQSSPIYSGEKIVRATGIFESDPYYASDCVSWNQAQVLLLIPSTSAVSGDYGGEVKLSVKTAESLEKLNSYAYSNSYVLSTINNGSDYSSVSSILADLSSFAGRWIQFKLEIISATTNLTPKVRSVLLTYTGAGKSVFVTKNFNVATQTTLSPTPKIRRGILTANFVENGGQLSFGYTTNPEDGNPMNYTEIIPNQIFTLTEPSENIKFGVIAKTASSEPCFFDDFGIQLDLGPNDVYFMPPQPSFEILQYVDDTGTAVTSAFQFLNKSVGIASGYNWSFGTSYPVGILTYYPPNEDGEAGPAINRQSPILKFNTPGPYTVGLTVTGYVENGIVFNSERYSLTFTEA